MPLCLLIFPSNPALIGNPPIPALPGKPSLDALVGAPISPKLRPRFKPSVAEGGLPNADAPGGAPSAERIMSFMRMYWYFERWETWV